MIAQKLTIENEVPFNQWLYNYVFITLDKRYIVETQEDNLKELGLNLVPEEMNEYAMSKADLVIRRDKLILDDDLKCMMVFVDGIAGVDCVSGMVTELKVDDQTSAPVWECYRNMSQVAASLAVQVLIKKVTMFGVVASVNNLDHTRLLKMECDFVCKFTRCQGDV